MVIANYLMIRREEILSRAITAYAKKLLARSTNINAIYIFTMSSRALKGRGNLVFIG